MYVIAVNKSQKFLLYVRQLFIFVGKDAAAFTSTHQIFSTTTQGIDFDDKSIFLRPWKTSPVLTPVLSCLSSDPLWPLGSWLSCAAVAEHHSSPRIRLGFSDRRAEFVNFELQITSDRHSRSGHINFWDRLDRRSGCITVHVIIAVTFAGLHRC